LEFQLSGYLNANQRYVTEYALELWSEQLAGTVPVDMELNFESMGSGVIGASYFTENFLDLESETWYPSPLWNQLVGYDATSERDIYILMNSDFNFYFGLDGNTSGIDYVTIVLHEVTHGLGFYSICSADDGYYWYGYDYPNIYDRMLYEGTDGPCLATLPPWKRAEVLVSNNLYAETPSLLAANEGERVKMYAPATYKPGSTAHHWDSSVKFPTFMKYAYAYPLHTFNDRKIGMLADIVWVLPEIDTANTVWITFDANGATGNRPPQPFSPGVTQKLKTNTFTNFGNEFKGWNTKQDGTGDMYGDRAPISILEDTTLYAQWKGIEYKLIFDANGGVVSPTSKPVFYNAPIGELPTPVREGYEFLDWRMDGSLVTEETIWKQITDRTAIARWQEIVKINEINTTPVIQIIPNPASNEVELRITIAGQAHNDGELRVEHIEFYNIFGQMVKSVPFTGQPCKGDVVTQKINVSDLCAGIYMVQVGGKTLKLVRSNYYTLNLEHSTRHRQHPPKNRSL
jgi:hypothetical protein